MADPFVAEIRIFPFNFAPRGWAFCDGQLLPISQNTALFSLLGTVYGGDGRSTFALPDLRGAVPMHSGQGAGLSDRVLGEMSGVEAVSLLESQIPNHSHALRASNADSNSQSPANQKFAAGIGGISMYITPGPNAGPSTTLNGLALAPSGGGLPHNNMQPYLTLNFCIAMQGVYPSRP